MAKAPPHASSAGAGDWKMPAQMERWKQGKQGGKKSRHAYNTYVQRDRLNQFYDRKKVLGKYKRACRFEAKTGSAADGSGTGSSRFRPELLQQGVDEWEQEYERRMALSFGDSASSSNAANDANSTAPRKKRRGGDRAVKATEVVEEAGTEDAEDQLHRSRRRKLKSTKPEESHGATEASAPIVKDSARKTQAQDGVDPKALKKTKKKASTGVPDRFSKDLKEFKEKREAEANEQQRRRDEEFARKRQRRETAKGRAMKGQLLSQRTARGQPKMQGILEAITGKLASEQQQKPLRHSGERAPVSGSGRAGFGRVQRQR